MFHTLQLENWKTGLCYQIVTTEPLAPLLTTPLFEEATLGHGEEAIVMQTEKATSLLILTTVTMESVIKVLLIRL